VCWDLLKGFVFGEMNQPAGFFMLNFYLNTTGNIETFLISHLYEPAFIFARTMQKPQKTLKI
jgi:hypothetical protein